VHHVLDDFAIACTWIFGIVGLAASATTVNGLRSRPRVAAKWTTDVAPETEPRWEGLVVDVRSRQRPVRIERLEIESDTGSVSASVGVLQGITSSLLPILIRLASFRRGTFSPFGTTPITRWMTHTMPLAMPGLVPSQRLSFIGEKATWFV
jgi:hypothetical protein